MLYLIEILHQTTTMFAVIRWLFRLYLIEILHQTTTRVVLSRSTIGCILSKFYIKPQQSKWCVFLLPRCILSKFYIKPQRNTTTFDRAMSCILSKFYIKPQLCWVLDLFIIVVSYRNSTSNHNRPKPARLSLLLYLIEILHQTTTCGKCEDCLRRCILSKFYIKPQRSTLVNGIQCGCILSKFYIKPQRITPDYLNYQGCILSKFYIKPQRRPHCHILPVVVSYRNSTSNHNV